MTNASAVAGPSGRMVLGGFKGRGLNWRELTPSAVLPQIWTYFASKRWCRMHCTPPPLVAVQDRTAVCAHVEPRDTPL